MQASPFHSFIFHRPSAINSAGIWVRSYSQQARLTPNSETPPFLPDSCQCKWKITDSFDLCMGTSGSHGMGVRVGMGELGATIQNRFFPSQWIEGKARWELCRWQGGKGKGRKEVLVVSMHHLTSYL